MVTVFETGAPGPASVATITVSVDDDGRCSIEAAGGGEALCIADDLVEALCDAMIPRRQPDPSRN